MNLRLLAAAASVILLASCYAPRAGTSRPDEDVPTSSTAYDLDGPDLERLVSWLTGSFSNTTQAEADPEQYVDARVDIVPIWLDRADGFWLYAEHTVGIDPDRPYQQRVLRLLALVDGSLRIDVFEFPENPERYAGALRSFEPLSDLTPEDLVERVGCALTMRRESDDMIVGRSEGTGCPSERDEAAYATSQLMVGPDMLVMWDRGYDLEGRQVWGPENGGYLFRRLSADQLDVTEVLTEVAPPAQPAPPSREERAAEYSAKNGGRAVVIMRAGDVVFEQYDNGHDADRPHRLASGSASFWGVLAAAAAQDGLFDLDEPVSDTVTEWVFDDAKSRITIRQLLNCTSGLEPGLRNAPSPEIPDRFQYSLSLPTQYAAGEAFTYGPSHLEVFGELLYRKLAETGDDPVAYLRRRLLEPAQITIDRWQTDQAGNAHMFYGAYMTGLDWARFGQLVCSEGVAGGQRLIEADRLDECFIGSEANRWYGLSFWLGVGDGTAGGFPADIVRAMGSGHQRLFVIPSLETVIVRLGESGEFSDVEFLTILLGRSGAE